MPVDNRRYFIYSITSNKADGVYIGSSVVPYRRFKSHMRMLLKNQHHSYKLQKHFNESKPVLTFTILAECTAEEVEYKELALILAYDSIRMGFNVKYKTLRNPTG